MAARTSCHGQNTMTDTLTIPMAMSPNSSKRARELAQRMLQLTADESMADLSECGTAAKAQRKLAERILRAGAIHTKLWPGKRGKYEIMIYNFTGFDASRDAEIGLDDPIPEKPWIACNLSWL